MSADHLDASEERLDALVRRRLESFRQGLGPRLGLAYDELNRRLGLDREPDQPSNSYFLAHLALPVIQLPGWVAGAATEGGALLPQQILDDLVEAAAVGYLHVRLQDDLLDEGVGRPGEVMLLAEALFLRHQRLLADVVGARPRFWELFERVWLGYQEAMLLENDLLRARIGYDADAFDRVLRRSQPLVIPAAAALFAADRPERLGELETLVWHLTRAHQLFHDLIHIAKDLGQGNHTYLVQRFGGAEGMATVRRQLFWEGGFDRVTAEALGDLGLARQIAERASWADAVRALDARRALMERTQRDTFASFFHRILAKESGNT